MTSKVTTIVLDPPLSGSGLVPLSRVILREPTVFDVLELGDPYTVGMSPEGTQFVAENPEVVTAYVRRCLIEPRDPSEMNTGGVQLARKVKKALFDFFLSGDEEGEASGTSPTISPLEPAGAASSISAV